MKKTLFTILILAALAAILVALFFYFFPRQAVAPGEEVGFQEFSPLEIAGEITPEGIVIVGEEGEELEEILVPGEEIMVGEEVKKINKVTDRGVAGGNIIYNKNGELIIYYVDSSNGNIYRKKIDKNEIFGSEERITTTIIPGVHEAFFTSLNTVGQTKQNAKVVLRYAKEDFDSPSGFVIETFLGNLPKENTDGTFASRELRGIFLEQNITDLSVSPDTNKLFYLANLGDKVLGMNYDLTSAKKVQIFSSSFTEWLSQYATSKSIILTAKASSDATGASYLLDIASKNYSKIMGGINGLTTLMSPSGKFLLYGGSDGALKIFDLDKKTSAPLGLNSLSEKCVWSKDNINIYCAAPDNLGGSLPDDWYKGLVSFSDSVWKVNTRDGNTTLLLEAKDFETPLDMVNLKLNEKGNYLFFTNKKDGSLWVITL